LDHPRKVLGGPYCSARLDWIFREYESFNFSRVGEFAKKVIDKNSIYPTHLPTSPPPVNGFASNLAEA